ncbi:MAG: rhodanese-like domain-containing protein [Longimicrobiales bacterium]|nr:rhodanese-like domain-containing protein [Longimicrobiales bacterium]
MFFRQIFDPELAQYAYIIGCQATGEALVIDPERDIDRYVEIASEEGLRIVAATETHIHADFLSGTREFAEQHGVKLYLSDEGDEDWKYEWARDSDYEVQLLEDGDTFDVGNIRVQAVHTPGHTPEHLSFLVTDRGGGASEPMGIASGDFVFVGDLGRPDLLETAAGVAGAREPSARRLFDSTKRFLALEDHVQVWPGHGAGSACGKALGAVPQSTVGYERRFNAGLSFEDEERFVGAILEGQPEPPLYFARMKTLNKEGVPVLGDLPTPKLCSIDELTELAEAEDAVVVDTRMDRKAFMAGHVPGSIYAPLGINFPMIVGSYVDPETRIFLLVDEADLDEAVRTLVRIGYDRIAGYAPPSTLIERGLSEEVIPRVDFKDLPEGLNPEERTILDVRNASEYAGGHVPGAMNIAHTRLAERIGEIPRDKPVLAYCRTGNRSSAAAALLAREGFDVTFVDGMFDAWPGREKAEREEAVAAV